MSPTRSSPRSRSPFWPPIWCCWAVLPYMIERSGAIVNLGSHSVVSTHRVPSHRRLPEGRRIGPHHLPGEGGRPARHPRQLRRAARHLRPRPRHAPQPQRPPGLAEERARRDQELNERRAREIPMGRTAEAQEQAAAIVFPPLRRRLLHHRPGAPRWRRRHLPLLTAAHRTPDPRRGECPRPDCSRRAGAVAAPGCITTHSPRAAGASGCPRHGLTRILDQIRGGWPGGWKQYARGYGKQRHDTAFRPARRPGRPAQPDPAARPEGVLVPGAARQGRRLEEARGPQMLRRRPRASSAARTARSRRSGTTVPTAAPTSHGATASGRASSAAPTTAPPSTATASASSSSPRAPTRRWSAA